MDSFETDRLFSQFPAKPEQLVTFSSIQSSVQTALDNDLKHCIDAGFEKLDIFNEKHLRIKTIKMALLTTMKLHNKTSMKVHLKNLQRVLNDSFIKRQKYAKKDF